MGKNYIVRHLEMAFPRVPTFLGSPLDLGEQEIMALWGRNKFVDDQL
jgi:hypothetical protein